MVFANKKSPDSVWVKILIFDQTKITAYVHISLYRHTHHVANKTTICAIIFPSEITNSCWSNHHFSEQNRTQSGKIPQFPYISLDHPPVASMAKTEPFSPSCRTSFHSSARSISDDRSSPMTPRPFAAFSALRVERPLPQPRSTWLWVEADIRSFIVGI